MGEAWQHNSAWKSCVDLIRCTNRDVIFTMDWDDRVNDHSDIGKLAFRAAIWTCVANLPDTRYPPIDYIPTVVCADTVGMAPVAPPNVATFRVEQAWLNHKPSRLLPSVQVVAHSPTTTDSDL